MIYILAIIGACTAFLLFTFLVFYLIEKVRNRNKDTNPISDNIKRLKASGMTNVEIKDSIIQGYDSYLSMIEEEFEMEKISIQNNKTYWITYLLQVEVDNEQSILS